MLPPSYRRPPYPPPRRRAPILKYLLIVSITCALIAAGVAIGWRLSTRPTREPFSAATATSTRRAASSLSPTIQPMLATTPTLQPENSSPNTTSPAAAYYPPNLAALQTLALRLINEDRAANGLSPVAWDEAAAQIAQTHAEDMLAGPYFSHWNRQGYGPDHRAALQVGFTDAIFENIHSYWLRTSDDQPASIEDWPQRVLDAQAGLMDSPGHRANILDPAHTHVGVGIAYRAEIGELRLVQEFVNRYVQLDPLPAELPDDFVVSGRLLAGASDPLINLAYELFPEPLSLEQLAQTSSYQSSAEFFSAPRTDVQGDRFTARVLLDPAPRAGLYHLHVFVTVDGERVLAAEVIVPIRD